jgi:NADPH:quinone reductase
MEATRVVIKAPGGPEAMVLEKVILPPPGPGEVQVEQTAIGLNYLDVYMRSGMIPLPLPAALGTEAAGHVIAVGEGVDLRVGERVAYAGIVGSYATHRNLPAARMVRLPDGVTDEVAAASLLKGLTVSYLLGRTYRVQKGDPVLFWAASGGVGQLAGQWGADLGAEMIGVTAGAENCALIRGLGYAHALDRKTEDIAARVREITGGKGVPVVYDSVGKASFDVSLACLRPMGMLVSFGATTGPAPPVAAATLQKRRVAVLYPAHVAALHGRKGGPRSCGGGVVCPADRWPREGQHRVPPPSVRDRGGACGLGERGHHRVDRAGAVT